MKQMLLIIDVQQELIDGNQEVSPIFYKQQLVSNVNKVIEMAREANVPVVFVRDLDVAKGKGDGFQIHNEINVPIEAKIFDKSATNAFYGTGLLEYLKSQQIKHIVIMGCETQHCIDSAVRTATISGFDVTLVGDGHSTVGNDVLSAEQIIKHHNTTLHGHYNVDHFSVVRNSSEDLFYPTHDSYR
ncbi:MAG: cysteine hydrolase family protein [Solibacillus sp.]